MDELIFYSIPGALVMLSAIALRPSSTDLSPVQAVLGAALVPLVGYIFHQLYRLLFEFTGNFERASRRAITYIHSTLPRPDAVPITRRQAFLIWELGIYHKDVSAPFRDHDARSWHFILSFWASSLAALLGCAAVIVASLLPYKMTPLWPAWPLLGVGLLLLLKGRNTYNSLNDQEVAFVRTNQQLFFHIMAALLEAP